MVNHEEYNRVEPLRRDVLQQCIAEDADIQELICAIKEGWPDKKECPLAVQPYHYEQDELIESQGLVFCGEQLVVPSPSKGHVKPAPLQPHRCWRMCSLCPRNIVVATNKCGNQRLFLIIQSAKHTTQNRPTRSFSHTSYPRTLGRKLVPICLFLDSRHY